MGEFIDINTKMTSRAKQYILTRKSITARAVIGGIILFAVILGGIPTKLFFLGCGVIAIYLLGLFEEKKNKELLALIQNGVLTYGSLTYVSEKNATVKPNKVNMRYFYDLEYYDLNENLIKIKFAFLQRLNEQDYKKIPIFFYYSNPRKGVILHKHFCPSKNNMRGMVKDNRLFVHDGELDVI